MLKKILIIIFTSFSLKLNSQIELIARQEIPNFYSPLNYIDSSNNIFYFPDFIKNNTNQILKLYTGEFYDSIYFIKGQTINLKKLFKDNNSINSNFRNCPETNSVIPKYELYFGLKDQTLRIERIIIKISLDEYGQILEFNWPCLMQKKKDFQETNIILNILNDLTKTENNKIPLNISINFDSDINNFAWYFEYDSNKNLNFKQFKIYKIPAFKIIN